MASSSILFLKDLVLKYRTEKSESLLILRGVLNLEAFVLEKLAP